MWYEAGCSRKVEGKYPGGAAGGGGGLSLPDEMGVMGGSQRWDGSIFSPQDSAYKAKHRFGSVPGTWLAQDRGVWDVPSPGKWRGKLRGPGRAWP